MLGDDLDAWLAESALMKRTFRINALISGLNRSGATQAGEKWPPVTVSSDLLYDVLRKHDPGHILLESSMGRCRHRPLDIARIGDFLRP